MVITRSSPQIEFYGKLRTDSHYGKLRTDSQVGSFRKSKETVIEFSKGTAKVL